MESPLILSGIAAIILSVTHLTVNQLTFLRGVPRSKWLSIAGGISVTYIFIHVLPELEKWQQEFMGGREEGFLKHHLYIVALLGLVVFFCIERQARLSRSASAEQLSSSGPDYPTIFWFHIASFALYNALIGYLLVHRDTSRISGLVFFTLAMFFHFVVNDYGLHEHYAQRYRTTGRWVVSAAILVGWLTGVLTPVSTTGIALIFAFIAGGNILNVLKEELPEERKSNYWAFFAGIAGYTILLLLVA